MVFRQNVLQSNTTQAKAKEPEKSKDRAVVLVDGVVPDSPGYGKRGVPGKGERWI